MPVVDFKDWSHTLLDIIQYKLDMLMNEDLARLQPVLGNLFEKFGQQNNQNPSSWPHTQEKINCMSIFEKPNDGLQKNMRRWDKCETTDMFNLKWTYLAMHADFVLSVTDQGYI